ncbi:hypothetical protein PIB30_003669 [Stylosanthes scabra]|uniref:Uncharacterized protein n=1 Tax=Stylosanthes scabra TaxID=79078 RepID=A0ABU6Z1C5_9FABA|nr:hypothetical protein [Stylosanthes scabra]
MYLQGVWDSRNNRMYKGRRLGVDVKGLMVWGYGWFRTEYPTFPGLSFGTHKSDNRLALTQCSGPLPPNMGGRKFRALRVALEGEEDFVPFCNLSGEMAESQGNDLGEVVREVEGAQMPHELNPLYNCVNRDVLGSSSTLTEEYLTELKSSGVICGGGKEERLYRVELPRRGERRDTTDVLLWLFSKGPLKPKAVLGNPERARAAIVKMDGKNKTLAHLRQVMQANPQGLIFLSPSGGQASSSAPEGGASSNVGGGARIQLEVSSPIWEEGSKPQSEVPPSSPSKKRQIDETISAQKRPRTWEGSQRDFCPIDRSFDASGYIESNFLGSLAREALRDYDLMESLRWAQWAIFRLATIMKSIEPHLTVTDQWEQRCAELTGDLNLFNQQKVDAEKGKDEAKMAKSKAEKDLESALARCKE